MSASASAEAAVLIVLNDDNSDTVFLVRIGSPIRFVVFVKLRSDGVVLDGLTSTVFVVVPKEGRRVPAVVFAMLRRPSFDLWKKFNLSQQDDSDLTLKVVLIVAVRKMKVDDNSGGDDKALMTMVTVNPFER